MIERIPLSQRLSAARHKAEDETRRQRRALRLAEWLRVTVQALDGDGIVTLEPGEGWRVTVMPYNRIELQRAGQTVKVEDAYGLLGRLADEGACPDTVLDGHCPACGRRILPTEEGDGVQTCCPFADYVEERPDVEQGPLAVAVRAAQDQAVKRLAGIAYDPDGGYYWTSTGVACGACGEVMTARLEAGACATTIECECGGYSEGCCDALQFALLGPVGRTSEMSSQVDTYETARAVGEAAFRRAGLLDVAE